MIYFVFFFLVLVISPDEFFILSTFPISHFSSTLTDSELSKLTAFRRYIQKYWLTQIKPDELSIFDLENGTNNGAECYHSD